MHNLVKIMLEDIFENEELNDFKEARPNHVAAEYINHVEVKTVSDTCAYSSNEFVGIMYDEFVGETTFTSKNKCKLASADLGIFECSFCRRMDDEDDLLFIVLEWEKTPSAVKYGTSNFLVKIGTTVFNAKSYKDYTQHLAMRGNSVYYLIDKEMLKAICEAKNVTMQLRFRENPPNTITNAKKNITELARQFYNGAYEKGANEISKLHPKSSTRKKKTK